MLKIVSLAFGLVTTVLLLLMASSNLESYTETKPVSSESEKGIHGENNSPMFFVFRLQKKVDVSMCGIIAVKESINVVELNLIPMTHYVTGFKYSVPSFEYIFYKGDQYVVLDMRLVDHIFEDVQVYELEVKIILPEGLTDLELRSLPHYITREEDTLLHYGYLGASGRTGITLHSIEVTTESQKHNFQLW